VPLYEYRCKSCDEQFELRRSFADADVATQCPSGHDDVVRLLPVFAAVGRSTAPAPSAVQAPPPAPCGAHCACHAG